MARQNLCPIPACKYAAASGWYGGSRVTGLSGFSRSTGYVLGSSSAGGSARGQVFAGQTYTMSAEFRTSSSVTLSYQIHWYRNGSYLAATSVVSASSGSGVVRRFGLTATAPSGADQALLQILARSGTVTMTAVLLERASTIGSYFDGDSANARWDGADGASTSTLQDNQSVIVSGIPPVADVGAPTLSAYATVDLDAQGIPSAAAVGSPTIDYAKIRPTGIPSSSAVGSPRLTGGPVTMSVASIPSRAAFGTPRLRTTLSITGQLGATRRGVVYDLVIVARVPTADGPPVLVPGDPIPWKGLSYSDEVSKPQRLDVSAKIPEMSDAVLRRIADPKRLPSELHLYRGSQLVFAGPLITWQKQGETLTIYALGLLAYARYWRVKTDLVFSQVDQFAIGKALVDHHQGYPFGNFGIDTAEVGTSGVLRDATYLAKENHIIGTRLEELGKRQNGFDIDVDPITRALKFHYPIKGIDRSAGEQAIVFDGSNIIDGDVSGSVAPGDIASDAWGVGTGDSSITSHVFDEDVRAHFGLADVGESFDGVSEQATLDAHTQGLLDARQDALIVPGSQTRVTPDTDPTLYGAGDTVSYNAPGRLGVSGAFRLRKRTITVSEQGRETASFEFA